MSRRANLVGRKFGMLEVLADTGENQQKCSLWLCRCECGNEARVNIRDLTTGNKRSCGCLRGRTPTVGEVYGRLTVTRKLDQQDGNGHDMWHCVCECGNELPVRGYNLTGGNTKSCGCKRRKDRHLHGNWKGAGEIGVRVWATITHNAKKRGISVNITKEQAWQLFVEQDGKCAYTGMPLQFAEGGWQHMHGWTTASLDRKDSDGDYDLHNVHWVHKDINKMKREFEESYFISLCKMVADNAERNP